MQIMLSIYLNSSTCKYLSLDNGVTMTSKRRENINLVSFICLSFLLKNSKPLKKQEITLKNYLTMYGRVELFPL